MRLGVLVFLVLVAGAASVTVPGKGGNITIGPKGYYFYWLFEAEEVDPVAADTPFVMWLSGGPGCASSFAALTEIGPYRVKDDLTLEKNPFGWSRRANLLTLDQPFGTGLSSPSSDPPLTNTSEIAANICVFVQNFMAQNLQYSKQPFYVTGESYGGHMVPAAAKTMLESCGPLPINLQGIAVGNGLIDPLRQMPGWRRFLADYGLLNATVLAESAVIDAKCQAAVAKGDMEGAYDICHPFFVDLLLKSNLNGQGPINIYNRRLTCDMRKNILCYNFTAAVDYLNLPEVQQALGVPPQTYQICNMNVLQRFTADFVTSYADGVTALLNAGIRAVVYVGVLDYACNYNGMRAFASSLEWRDAYAYRVSVPRTWVAGGSSAGQVTEQWPFAYVEVADAGHMTPMDQPAAAYDILHNLVSGSPFHTRPLPY